MLSRSAASGNKNLFRRLWSVTLSSVLVVTLLQVFPATSNATDNVNPAISVDLITRSDNDGQTVSLSETSLVGVQQGGSYRFDIQIECGLLDYVNDNSDQVIVDGNYQPVVWTSQGTSVSFVGLPAEIEQALDNLRIVQAPSEFGPPLNCDSSIAQTWLAPSNSWTGNTVPQGQAGYYLTTLGPIPVMFDYDIDPTVATPRFLKKSDGFEVEWNEYLGAPGLTPSGYTLRYRDVTNSGAWIYQTLPSGDYVSAAVSELIDPGITYEAQVAPIVSNCDGTTFYGQFSYMANISQSGIDIGPNATPVGQARTTGHAVASQCSPACAPVESVAFDGTKLATIYKFTNANMCTWTVPSNLTSTTVDAYVVGGGGGGGVAGGGGGGGGEVEIASGIAITAGSTWTLKAGIGGRGAQDSTDNQGGSGANSVVNYPNSNSFEAIIALGGGGGGTKDQLGTNSASVISGGSGINTGATQAMSYGGSSSVGSGDVGTNHDLISGRLFGTGGNGAAGSTSGSAFVTGIFGSGGGGGAVCAGIEALNYSGGNSQNNGYGGDCRGNSQPGSRDGQAATANTGGGGGGGARDFDFGDGAGGNGANGVVYIVQTRSPKARYLPSSCVDISGVCTAWKDTTGNPDLTASVTGVPVVSETSNPVRNGSVLPNSIPVVQGTPSDSIVFPASVMPFYHTLFTVARYNEKENGSYERIFDGKSDGSGVNWLSGFWGSGNGGHSGVAFHGENGTSSSGSGWLTPVSSIHDFNWVVSTDQNNLYRSNGTTRSYSDFTGGISPSNLTINGGDHAIEGGEASDFQVADIIVFDQELSESEYLAVESYLSVEYGICVASCSPPVFSTTSPLPDGEVNQQYSQTISASSPDGHSLSYSIVDPSNLPLGLSFDSELGSITGVPTVSGGPFSFSIEVTDDLNGQSARSEFTITVNEFVPPPPELTAIGCEDYSNSSFVPDNFLLDSNGYPIGCDMTGQESVTPDSWSETFDTRADLDFFNLRNGWRCDDCSIGLDGEVDNGPGGNIGSNSNGLPLGFSFNYYGKTYDSVFVNSNGSLTLGAPSTCYDQTLTQIMRCGGTSGTSAIVAYGVDLDNRNMNPDVWGNPQGPDRHADFFYWGKTTVDGKDAFVATWMNSPGYCSGNESSESSELGYEFDTCAFVDFNGDPIGVSYEDTLSTFQIVIIDQSGANGGVDGDADVIINYGSMQDSRQGYDNCDILRGESNQYIENCQSTADRYLAAGLGSTSINAENSELWDSSVTSLEALDGAGPGTILYNGIDASQVGDGAAFALSSARQFAESIPGQFTYQFRSGESPDVATPPSTPIAGLANPTENTISVSIAPPTDNGGAPVLVYRVEYRVAGETNWNTASTDVQFAEPSATYVLGGLVPSTNYEIRVFANNGIGNSEPTEIISLSTTAMPGAPETPRFASPNPLIRDDYGWVAYRWDELNEPPGTYSIRYRPTSQGTGPAQPWKTNVFAQNQYEYQFRVGYTQILNPDTEYEFQISAQNEVGSSAWSESALVTTSPISDRVLEFGDVNWNGYGSAIYSVNNSNDTSRVVYDGALKVFIGTNSRSTATQIGCNQSSISYPGFDVGVEAKQGHREWETAETRVQGGYTVTCAPETITLDSGDQVEVSLSRFFFTDSPWTRVMIDVTNLGQSDISAGVWLESKLQPDSRVGDTTYEVSSSDLDPTSPTTGDRWVVTGDNKQSGMVVAHVFGQPLGDVDTVNSQTQELINQDGYDQFRSEFSLNLPGTSSSKSNRARMAWFDGIVQYDDGNSADELDINYAGAIATAKAAAENFTKVKSQLTDTYPRFVPPTLTNFRMPDQINVSPGMFNGLQIAKVSGLDPTIVNYQLRIATDYIYGQIPTTYRVTQEAKNCLNDSFNSDLFNENTEIDNVDLTVVGSQSELNCFLAGLTFSVSQSPIGFSSAWLEATLSENVDGIAHELSIQSTELRFNGSEIEQTFIDVESGNATWRGVGTGINDVETRSNRNAFDAGSLKAYWIPNLNSDPLVDGIEIRCPQDALETSYTEGDKAKRLDCKTDEVVTPGGTLSIQISRDFAKSDPWQQLELNVINHESTEIGGAIAYRLDLGSDENTQIEMTSDGDLNLESADSWFITSDDGQRTDPVLLHYVGHVTGQKITRGSGANVDKIWVKTPLAVAGGAQVMKRYLEGVVDSPRGQIADSVITAMRAADGVANNKYSVPGESMISESLNILDTSLSAAVTFDRNLPALHTIYECRDFGRNALGPINLQQDGKVIGCDAYDDAQYYGPGDGPGSSSLNEGLFPGDPNLNQSELEDSWANTFSSTFPNAKPRLGWACDNCIITREGAITDLAVSDLPAGLPLGFSTHVDEGGPSYDSIRIFPQGLVQLHDSTDTGLMSGQIVSAFGNGAMSNGVLQGNWNEMPDYDFFYWGRTMYQGRVAFVVTWVKIPTVEYRSSEALGAQTGDPISDLEPTSVQLMIVSDSNYADFTSYMDTPFSDRVTSNADIIWNFDSIQSEGAQSPYTTTDVPGRPLFSGLYSFNNTYMTLTSDASIENDDFDQLGIATDTCSTATCIASELLTNKFQSPIPGRYVLGFRDYSFAEGPPGGIQGFIAPAAPRFVEVSREQADVAEVSWKAPKPWLINSIGGPLAGARPILGYRIEYSRNDRGENWNYDVYPALNQPPLLPSDLGSTVDGGESRYSFAIEGLQTGQQYTFRVYAVYAGLDMPDPTTDLMFDSEVRGVPSLANEQHVSDLVISPVGLHENPMALGAQAIAGQIAGNLSISNATINGSPYASDITARSVATFTGGAGSIGFDQGLVISPLVDARTFERGSGITGPDSKSPKLSNFTSPQERAKYEGLYSEFDSYLLTQESWVPGDPGEYLPVCNSNPGPLDLCTNGMTVLQFDVTPTADFLKFEYALAGTETGGELYGYPDGFGLFVGGIDQSHSCALVPEFNGTTPEQRFVTTANALEARLATYVPFDSDLHAATITSTMTCSADVSSNADTQTPVTVTMVIANADDQVLSPAVFLKGDSVRFENTSIQARDIPAATIFQNYESVSMSATGTAPTSWSAIGLPDGMTLTGSGDLEGTPRISGNFDFTVNALDEFGTVIASQAFSILVNGIQQNQPVSNIRLNLDEGFVSWDEPSGSQDGMTYDVLWGTNSSSMEYVRTCNDLELQGATGTSYCLNLNTNSNVEYHFSIIAHWPDGGYSRADLVRIQSRDICIGATECDDPSWDQVNSEIDDALTSQRNGDAFDGALSVYVGTGSLDDAHQVNCDYSTLALSGDSEKPNSSVVCEDDVTPGLTLKLSRYFFGEEQWVRTMVEATNTSGDPYDGKVWLVSNMGSDDDTNYEATSTSITSSASANPVTYSSADSWAVTSDTGFGDPVAVHIFGDDISAVPTSAWGDDANVDGDDSIVTEFDLAIQPSETAKRAWFDGLVGYQIGNFGNAVFRAQNAADEIMQQRFEWTGNLDSVQLPTLRYNASPMVCPVSQQSPKLSAVVLSNFTDRPTAGNVYTDGYINGPGDGVSQALCNSSYLDTRFFDGGDGSEETWMRILDGADVLVLTRTTGSLVGSNLMSADVIPALRNWAQGGGRIVFTAGSQFIPELEGVLGVSAGTFESVTVPSDSQALKQNAISSLPSRLGLGNWDLSRQALKLTYPNMGEFNGANYGGNLLSLYGENIWNSEGVYTNPSAATNFTIGRGQVNYLSSDLSFYSEGPGGISTSPWGKLLLQSVYGSAAEWLTIVEGREWYPNANGTYWTESDPSAQVSLGDFGSLTNVPCLNTVSRPTILKVRAVGTEMLCGTIEIQDGAVDGGVTAQLTRTFYSQGPWLKTSLALTNNDYDLSYSRRVTFGGSQAQYDDQNQTSMQIEATSSQPEGTTNLNAYNNNARDSWIVASAGANVRRQIGDWTTGVVVNVYGREAEASFGGSGRGRYPLIGDDTVLSSWWPQISPRSTVNYSWFTGVVDFQPGCDRTAVAVAKQGAIDLNSQFDLERGGNDGWDGLAEIPALSTTSCQSFAGTATNAFAANSGTNVNLSWRPVAGATGGYEVSYREGSSGDWSTPRTIQSNADTTITTQFADLRRDTDFEFRIRAKRVNYGVYGDTGIGPWTSDLIAIRTSSTATPTPTPTPTVTSTPTPGPVIALKSQVLPTVPKSLAVKKTIKFTMKTKAGLALVVSSSGTCKTTKITVKKKVGKKFVTTQTGWLVTATKKGSCSVKFKAPGNTSWKPLNETKKVPVK